MANDNDTQQSVEREFENLLNAFLDGELGTDGIAAFESLVEKNVDLQAEACDRLSEHRLLGLLHQEAGHDEMVDAIVTAAEASDAEVADAIMESVDTSSGRKRGPRRTLASFGWLAALAVLLIVAVPLWWRSASTAIVDADKGAVAEKMIGTLLVAEDCVWVGKPLVEGQRLPAGPIELERGLAIIRFDGGAEAVLSAPSRLKVISPGSAKLDHGGVTVLAPDEATGFVLLTPESELVDLGTEFSVRVGGDGGTTLDVLDGEVVVRPLERDSNEAAILEAGRAVAIDTPQSRPRAVPVTSRRFASIVEGAKLRSRWELTHAYEGFFYPVGRVALSDSTRGKGWVGPWRERRGEELRRPEVDDSSGLQIVSGNMNVTWPVPGGRAGMLELPVGFTARIREMKRPIDLSRDETTFFSMMVREPEHPANRKPGEHREAVRLTFRSSDDYFGGSMSFGFSNRQRPQILSGQGMGSRGQERAPSDQSTLWLGKLVSRSDGADEALFRIYREDEELGYGEPSQWDVVVRDLDFSARLNLVVLSSAGASPRVVDELRIGPTFRSVAPMPEQAVAVLDAVTDNEQETLGQAGE